MGWYPYAAAAALVVVALILAGRGGGNRLRARDISGSTVHVGDESSGKPEPDRVAWAIGIVGVLIAAVQLARDIWGGK